MRKLHFLAALAGLLVAQAASAKVPRITLAATCNQATAVFVARILSVQGLPISSGVQGTHSRARALVENVLSGNMDASHVELYFQPESRVSAVFKSDRSYVIFGQSFKDGYATVNGYAGAFEIVNDQVEDSLLRDGTGAVTVSAFVERVKSCKVKPQ